MYDEYSNKPVVCMYRQYAGYPDGHGRDLAEFLQPIILINGIGSGQNRKPYANGMGCLAAQMVAHFKIGVGGFYLYPTDTYDASQDYEYHIYSNKVIVKGYKPKPLFEGTWKEFYDWVHKDAEDHEEGFDDEDS